MYNVLLEYAIYMAMHIHFFVLSWFLFRLHFTEREREKRNYSLVSTVHEMEMSTQVKVMLTKRQATHSEYYYIVIALNFMSHEREQ